MLRLSDTDRSILERRFRCDEPEHMEKLVDRVPEADATPHIEYWYDVTPKSGDERQRIRCVHCRSRRHWMGLVVRHGEDRLLVGNRCGAKIYGSQFEVIRRGFTDDEGRKLSLQRLIACAETLEPLRHYLATLPGQPRFRAATQLHGDLVAQMPRLTEILAEICRNERGIMSVDRRQRDLGTEARAEGRNGPIRGGSDSYGRVQGKLFLDAGQNSTDRLQSAISLLDSAAADLAGKSTESISNAQIAGFFHKLSKLERALRQVLSLVPECQAFARTDNLDAICAWASNTTRAEGRFSREANRITWRPFRGARGHDLKIVVLPDLAAKAALDTAAFEQFRNALHMKGWGR